MPDASAQPVQRSRSPSALSRTRGMQAPAAVAALLPQTRLATLPMGYAVNMALPYATEAPLPYALPTIDDAIRSAESYTQPFARTPESPPPAPGQAPVQRTALPPAGQQAHAAERRPVEHPPVPAQPQPASIQRQPLAAPALEQAEEPAASKTLDADWPRLQNILRRHQEREATIAEQPAVEMQKPEPLKSSPRTAPGRSPAVVQSSRQEGAPEPAHPSVTKERRIPKPVITEIEPSSPSAPTPMPVQLSPEQPAAEAGIKTENGETGVPTLQAQADEASEVPSPPATNLQRATETAQPTAAAQPVERKTRATKPAESAQEPAGTPPSEAKTVISPRAAEAVSQRGLSEPEIEPTEYFQPLPLDAVWPVQRQETDETALPTSIISPLPAVDDVEAAPPAPQDDGQLRDVLQSIAIQKPTDSLVELITPRKPRPSARPPLQKSDDDTQPALEQPFESIAVERPLETDASPVPAGAAQNLQTAFEASGVSESRSAKTTAAQTGSPPVQRQTVETEIGPLPADLWHLLGQKPPGGSEPAAQQAQPPTQSQIQRAIEHASKPAQPPVPQQMVTTFPPPGFVQRVEDTTATQAPAEEEPAGEGGAETQEEGKMDTDELARKVYAQIKRRLLVEWERLRRR